MSLIKNQALLKLKSKIRTICPELLIFGSRVSSQFIFYKEERDYLNGLRNSISKSSSILLFAPERCATQYTNQLVSEIFKENNGQSVLLPNYYFHANPDKVHEIFDKSWAFENLAHEGYFFGSFGLLRGEIDFDYSKYSVLATVRDPRDVLVSSFYSVAYAHAPSNRKFARDAKEARGKGIDWYVTQKWRCQEIQEKFLFIQKEISPLANSYVWKYEEMQNDFPTFINQLAERVLPDVDTSNCQRRIIEKHTLDTKASASSDHQENLNSHRRSGASGQFLEKLDQKSINYLNDFFADQLDYFNYS